MFRSFGIVRYHNYEDAENSIRGFYYLGYEVLSVGHRLIRDRVDLMLTLAAKTSSPHLLGARVVRRSRARR